MATGESIERARAKYSRRWLASQAVCLAHGTPLVLPTMTLDKLFWLDFAGKVLRDWLRTYERKGD